MDIVNCGLVSSFEVGDIVSSTDDAVKFLDTIDKMPDVRVTGK